MTDSVVEQKRLLRRELRAARAALTPQERAARSRAIVGHLDSLPELVEREVIAAFAATPAEVDLDDWLARLMGGNVTVALPVVRGATLMLAAVDDLAALVPGWRGIREPPPHAPSVDVGTVQVAVVPGVAFDQLGHRLGQGGGHIDRLLAARPPGCVVVGVAFGFQVVAAVPVEFHDMRVDLVVTEDGVVNQAR